MCLAALPVVKASNKREQALRKTTEQHPPSDSPNLEIIAEALFAADAQPKNQTGSLRHRIKQRGLT
jgi:hypothetical protein